MVESSLNLPTALYDLDNWALKQQMNSWKWDAKKSWTIK